MRRNSCWWCVRLFSTNLMIPGNFCSLLHHCTQYLPPLSYRINDGCRYDNSVCPSFCVVQVPVERGSSALPASFGIFHCVRVWCVLDLCHLFWLDRTGVFVAVLIEFFSWRPWTIIPKEICRTLRAVRRIRNRWRIWRHNVLWSVFVFLIS